MRDKRVFGLIGPDPADKRDELRRMIYVTYGRNGGATAWCYFSDRKLGRVSGGGWDITAGAVEAACHAIYCTPRMDGAMGLGTITARMAEHGVRVMDEGQMLWAIPTHDRRIIPT